MMLEQCGKEGPSLGGGPSNIYRKVIEGLILSYRRIYFWNYSFPLILFRGLEYMIALEDLKQSLLKTQNLLSAWFSMVSLYFFHPSSRS